MSRALEILKHAGVDPERGSDPVSFLGRRLTSSGVERMTVLNSERRGRCEVIQAHADEPPGGPDVALALQNSGHDLARYRDFLAALDPCPHLVGDARRHPIFSFLIPEAGEQSVVFAPGQHDEFLPLLGGNDLCAQDEALPIDLAPVPGGIDEDGVPALLKDEPVVAAAQPQAWPAIQMLDVADARFGEPRKLRLQVRSDGGGKACEGLSGRSGVGDALHMLSMLHAAAAYNRTRRLDGNGVVP